MTSQLLTTAAERRAPFHWQTLAKRSALLVSLVLLLSACAGTGKAPAGASMVTHSPMNQADSNRYQTALAQLNGGKSQAAVRSLQTLSSRYPADVGVWLNLAMAHYLSDELDLAEEALEAEALQANSLPHLHNLKGLIAVQRGDYKSAEEQYLAALALDPEHVHSHYNLALLYDIYYQDIRQALPHYQRYLALIAEEDKETVSWVGQIERSLAQGGRQ